MEEINANDKKLHKSSECGFSTEKSRNDILMGDGLEGGMLGDPGPDEEDPGSGEVDPDIRSWL